MLQIQRKKRSFWILLAISAALILLSVPASIVLSAASPPSDIDTVISSLRTGTAKSQSVTKTVEVAIARWGLVRRAVRIGYQRETRQGNSTWSESLGLTLPVERPDGNYDITQSSYLTLLQKSRMPVLLTIVQLSSSEKAASFNIEIGSLGRVSVLFVVIVAALAISIYKLRLYRRETTD